MGLNRIRESSTSTSYYDSCVKKWEDHLKRVDEERIKRGKRPLF